MLIDDLLQPDLRLVFCGTALSRASYQARAYYARPGNRFWPALAAVGITPRLFSPQEYPELLQLGIGLTDLCKTHFGIDSELPKGSLDAEALRQKIEKFRPHRLAFTSKNAARAVLSGPIQVGRHPQDWQGCQIWILPSPSGLATRFWQLEVWQALADELSEERF